MIRTGAALVSGLLVLAGPPAGAGAPEVLEALEMKGHRALLETMARAEHSPSPFTTDGCSGGLSDVWSFVAGVSPELGKTHGGHPPWDACCITHDRLYHDPGSAGSAEDSFAARLAADEALKTCVEETGAARSAFLSETYDLDQAQVQRAYDAIAEAMFAAVRVGGAPCTGLPWRWGYGYADCTAFRPESE